jgi:hypothetical protein
VVKASMVETVSSTRESPLPSAHGAAVLAAGPVIAEYEKS